MASIAKAQYIPLILLILALSCTIYLSDVTGWFLLYWVSFPIIVPLCAAVLQLAGKLKSQIIPVSGTITSILAIPFYLEFHIKEPGGDGQAVLIFAVMPFYQLCALVIISLAAYSFVDWKNKRSPH